MIKVAEEKNETLKKARVEMNYLTGDEEVGRLSELRKKWEMDRVSAINYAERKGEERGKKLGKKERNVEIAKEMKNKKIEVEHIAEITKLTVEEVEKL